MMRLASVIRLPRPILRPVCPVFAAERYYQRKCSSPRPSIDFLGIEREWQKIWDTRGTKIQEERDKDHPLLPFYIDHVHRPTISWKLQSTLDKKRGAGHTEGETNMVEQIVSSIDWEGPLSSMRMYQFDPFIPKYGKDIVRTCTIFNQSADTDSDDRTDERRIADTQEWFERVWDAVQVAHQIYKGTQAYDAPLVDIERADNPDMVENFVEFNINCVKSVVHIPPNSPGSDPILSYDMDEDTRALWLAAQEAILSMTHTSKTVNDQEVFARLTHLVDAIMQGLLALENVDDVLYDGVHYHSTRILLSLMAIFAPSFAEASWVALHYGHPDWHKTDDIDEEEGYGGDDEDLADFGLHRFPRRNDPGTLSSIFTQPFPEPEPDCIIKFLRREEAAESKGWGKVGGYG